MLDWRSLYYGHVSPQAVKDPEWQALRRVMRGKVPRDQICDAQRLCSAELSAMLSRPKNGGWLRYESPTMPLR